MCERQVVTPLFSRVRVFLTGVEPVVAGLACRVAGYTKGTLRGSLKMRCAGESGNIVFGVGGEDFICVV